MALKNLAEDYFKNLNSISSRLHHDLEEVKSSYESLWSTIPEKEQQAILTESIIKPEISIKYLRPSEHTKNSYAVKMIFDENCSYRDEHSGPFSFKTQSQRDLSIFSKERGSACTDYKTKLPTKQAIVKTKPIIMYNDLDNGHESDDSGNQTSSSLPKTGLDFLDNW
ncbi:uncharacterized protein C1orf198 homolog [Diabrotica undecimpunctata]|uniref:uncharacterized protein C1orf198 homolog n=1 Tax=Diabrotica undecimpunctata TaxID=50387 RepID=UPI003B63BE9A